MWKEQVKFMLDVKKIAQVLDRTEYLAGGVLFLLVFALTTGSRLLRLENAQAIQADKMRVIILNTKADLETLARKFKEKKITFNKEELFWAAHILGWKTFRAGRYEIDGAYSYNVLLSRIARGIQDPASVTILPGIDKQRFVDQISSELKMSSTELLAAMHDSALLASYNIERKDVFGRMLPETYLVYWDIKPKNLIERILSEFEERVVDKYKERINELGMTVQEAVTLASIIEWEATREDEKTKIAGLYWNRLNKGMKLQADPTVNYAVGERRRLLFEDLKIDHPYNTYIINGLPPGPITNPAPSTIRAVLYPQDHDYLYMVASPEGDHHIFSETYSEHLEASRRWRQWLQEQYRIKQEREAKDTAS